MSRRFVIALLVISAVVGLLWSRPSSAVTLIPPSLEFTDVDPATTVTSKVKLFNETATTISLFAETATFSALDETGTPNIQPGTSDEDLASWITVTDGPFTVEPGQRVEVPFTITLPADATPGGHYATILFSPKPSETTEQGQVAVTQKVGTLVLVRVKGIVNETGSIAEFTPEANQTSFNRLPVAFFLRFTNGGNVHLRPTGNLTIRNMLGGTSTVLPVNSDLGAVLPQSTRRFDLAWEKEPLAGQQGNFFQELKAEWNNFALGSYTATIDVAFGQKNDKTATQTIKFWVFPWRLFLAGAVVLIALIFLLRFIIRRYNRWIISKAGQTNRE